MIEEIKVVMMENSPLFAKFDSFNTTSISVEERETHIYLFEGRTNTSNPIMSFVECAAECVDIFTEFDEATST